MRRLVGGLFLLPLAFYVLCILHLLYLRHHEPLIVAVHGQHRVEAAIQRKPFDRSYTFVSVSQISEDLQRAVIAAEDGGFFHHSGVDWEELRKVWAENRTDGSQLRGASTITQQLVKNLFLTTRRSWVRKGFELALVPPAEIILSKERILELYLNIIEWGPGVYGAEAAARHHYGIAAAQVSREQAARLAACIPSPRTRRPERMDSYSAVILGRMERMGW